jgi:hypothetical protein
VAAFARRAADELRLHAGYHRVACIAYCAVMDRALATWGIVVVLPLVVMIGAMLAMRRQPRQASHQAKQLRMAKRAVRQMANESRRTRRGSLRGEGTGVDTPENFSST